jgi:hypothetical protein
MRKSVTITLASLLLSAVTFTVNGQQSADVSIPEKVKADIAKRHPNAHDLQASHEIHFGRHLLEVSFRKDDNEQMQELFETDGSFFTNELLLENLFEAPPAVKESLEKNFPGYTLNKAELIANPNGVGEEYEIYLTVKTVNWKISINEKGNIEGKDRY